MVFKIKKQTLDTNFNILLILLRQIIVLSSSLYVSLFCSQIHNPC